MATAKQLYANTLPTSGTIVYTVPVTITTIVKNIVLTNMSNSSATATLQFKGLDIISQYPVASKDTVTIDLSTVLTSGQTITVSQGTANAINCFISGVEVV